MIVYKALERIKLRRINMREENVSKGKYITVEEALNLIKSGDVIVTGLGAAEAKEMSKR